MVGVGLAAAFPAAPHWKRNQLSSFDRSHLEKHLTTDEQKYIEEIQVECRSPKGLLREFGHAVVDVVATAPSLEASGAQAGETAHAAREGPGAKANSVQALGVDVLTVDAEGLDGKIVRQFLEATDEERNSRSLHDDAPSREAARDGTRRDARPTIIWYEDTHLKKDDQQQTLAALESRGYKIELVRSKNTPVNQTLAVLPMRLGNSRSATRRHLREEGKCRRVADLGNFLCAGNCPRQAALGKEFGFFDCDAVSESVVGEPRDHRMSQEKEVAVEARRRDAESVVGEPRDHRMSQATTAPVAVPPSPVAEVAAGATGEGGTAGHLRSTRTTSSELAVEDPPRPDRDGITSLSGRGGWETAVSVSTNGQSLGREDIKSPANTRFHTGVHQFFSTIPLAWREKVAAIRVLGERNTLPILHTLFPNLVSIETSTSTERTKNEEPGVPKKRREPAYKDVVFFPLPPPRAGNDEHEVPEEDPQLYLADLEARLLEQWYKTSMGGLFVILSTHYGFVLEAFRERPETLQERTRFLLEHEADVMLVDASLQQRLGGMIPTNKNLPKASTTSTSGDERSEHPPNSITEDNSRDHGEVLDVADPHKSDEDPKSAIRTCCQFLLVLRKRTVPKRRIQINYERKAMRDFWAEDIVMRTVAAPSPASQKKEPPKHHPQSLAHHPQSLARWSSSRHVQILENLMYQYGSDKSYDDHGYVKAYSLFFEAVRRGDDAGGAASFSRFVTEIGIATGRSMQAWSYSSYV